MRMGDLVRQLDVGNSVAEFDEALDRYFVDTEPFRALIFNRADIVAGDKGTGKTAIFRTLQKRYRTIPALMNVEVVPAFNSSGNPAFQRLVQEPVLSEAQYISLWKTHLFSLVGNWFLEIVAPDSPNSLRGKLDQMLRDTDLRSADDTPLTIFSRLMNYLHNYTTPASAEIAFTFSETGIPIITPKVAFGQAAEPPGNRNDGHGGYVIKHENALRLLDDCLEEAGVIVWVVLDRLDEAFQGCPDVETPALRALLRTYLDLLEFKSVRLKLFLRRDLFRKIIKGGFVNLTHINARKVEIIWDRDDLLNLLCQRFRESGDFLKLLGLEDSTNLEIFTRVFPEQIEGGERKPTSWNWIMARIRDGNDVRPPRNLIDLVPKAREAQVRREEREPREFGDNVPVIEADAIRRGLGRLSNARVEDTLIAEAGEEGTKIEKFRKTKSEYNEMSLCQLLGVSQDALQAEIKPLIDIGFLELNEKTNTYKIPMLYRDGLGLTQGKAF
jgi:hypothetical protein